MSESQIGYWLTWGGTFAWGVCFWWMHRISSRQDSLLAELRDQAKRIEELSRIEHDILQQVHPEVGEIRGMVDEVTRDLADVRRDNIAQAVMAEQMIEQVAKIDNLTDKMAVVGQVAEQMTHVETMVSDAADAAAEEASAVTSSDSRSIAAAL